MPDSLKFKPFQKQDLARGALHDGFIASLDTGLGKTICGYTWALLKCGWTVVKNPLTQLATLTPQLPVLLIVPGDLHEQMQIEGWDKLRVQTRLLSSQTEFEALVRGPDGLPRWVDGAGPGEPPRPRVPPGFYLTSYTQLTTNNVARQQDPLDCDQPRSLLEQWALQEQSSHPSHLSPEPDGDEPDEYANVTHLFANRRLVWRDEFDLLEVSPDGARAELDKAFAYQVQALAAWRDRDAADKRRCELEAAHRILGHLFTLSKSPKYAQLTLAQQDFVIRKFLVLRFADYAHNEGECMEYPIGEKPLGFIPGKPETDTRPKRRVKCVYCPSLADQCYSAFDCVIVDEGVKMKGEDTYVGKGVRSMVARFRCILTATPIKNRLPDIFRLAWWAAGGRTEAHARFPYRDDSSEREQFAQTFMVSERNVSKEDAARAQGKSYRGRFTKLTAEICNVQRLWKLLAPIVLRRRKDECGEDLVPRIRKVVRVEMGTLQQQVYRYHLEAPYIDINDLPATGAKLQALRTAAADPTSNLLQDKGIVMAEKPCRCQKPPATKPKKTCPHCYGEGKESFPLPHKSGSVYTPKFAAVLSLIHEIIARHEQVLIGTVFHESHDHLGQLLRAAEVPYLLADGRTAPKQRGPLMQRFKEGDAPVCLGGLEAIANGHNLDTVNNVIIYAYSWAYDLIKQFLDRVWRLTSKKPVNVYVVLCNGTIDRKLESLNWEKTDSVELALDGRLIGERSEEIGLAQLLQIAQQEFNADSQTVDEAAIQREWPQLRAKLQAAIAVWQPDLPKKSPVQSLKPKVMVTVPSPVRSALQPSTCNLRLSPSDWRSQMKALAAALRAQAPSDHGNDLWASL